jgi:restriction system protein
MALPKESNIQLPLLKVIATAGGELTVQLAVERIAKFYDELTSEDQTQALASGVNKWSNRVQWAKFHLVQRGDLTSPSRGVWKITESGLERLEEEWDGWKPDYSEEQFEAASSSVIVSHDTADLEDLDPYESLDSSWRSLISNVKRDLVGRVLDLSPGLFEWMIGRLLEGIGYHNIKVTGHSGDGGIDGECTFDILGLTKVAFQAKRWQSQVGVREVRDFIGALEVRRIQTGIFVTTSDFSKDAEDAVRESGRVALVNGKRLAQLLIDTNLGVTTRNIGIPRIDEDFFEGLA